MKPTKSILCHRSNSGSSPRNPLSPPPSRQPASLSRRPPSPAFLGSVHSTPPFVPPPSRSRSETSLAPLPRATPAESFLYHRAGFSLMRQYNLPDAHEMSVTREKRIHTRCTYAYFHLQLSFYDFFQNENSQQQRMRFLFCGIFKLFNIF